MGLGSWLNVAGVLLSAGVALDGCASPHAHRQATAEPRPPYHGKLNPLPRVATRKGEQNTCESADPQSWSEARKDELFRRFDEWEERGPGQIANMQLADNRPVSPSACHPLSQ